MEFCSECGTHLIEVESDSSWVTNKLCPNFKCRMYFTTIHGDWGEPDSNTKIRLNLDEDYLRLTENHTPQMNQDVFNRRVESIFSLIKDAVLRKATNRDEEYRCTQTKFIDEQLEELTQLHEQHEESWVNYLLNQH